MKLRFYITSLLVLLSKILFAQVSLETTYDYSGGYSPIYEFTYLELDSTVIQYRENGYVSLVDNRVKNDGSTSLIRCYKTGEVSLIATHCKLQVYVGSNALQYGFSGYVSTFFKNGNKRSSYKLDSLGYISGNYAVYDTNGVGACVAEYRNNIIYNGYYVAQSVTGEVFLSRYSNGSKQKVYRVFNGELDLVKPDQSYSKPLFARKKLREFNRLYHVFDTYVLISPGTEPLNE